MKGAGGGAKTGAQDMEKGGGGWEAEAEAEAEANHHEA